MPPSSSKKPLRVAVVGAGLSGLCAARELVDAGHFVQCFDKARGVGGRTSLRRVDAHAFDHGAQYFTARDPRFRRNVASWVEEGVVAPWEGRITVIDSPGVERTMDEGEEPERFVGVPGMNAMAKRMARGLDVRVRSLVTALERDGSTWTLRLEDAPPAEGFDVVLITTPPVQAERLLAPITGQGSKLLAAATSVQMRPCWAAMVAFDGRFGAPFDGAFVNTGGLSWVCRNSAKPGRPEGDAWVLHASPEWTVEHLEHGREDVAQRLVREFERVCALGAPRLLHADAHRWMFSAAAEPRMDGAVYDDALGLGLAGDWLCGSKVQGAWVSGSTLAGNVLELHPR